MDVGNGNFEIIMFDLKISKNQPQRSHQGHVEILNAISQFNVLN